MAKRHDFRPGDWEAVAMRLDEIISAHSGEDPFEEALKLLVAKLAHEATPERSAAFLSEVVETDAASKVDHLLTSAQRVWPGILDPGARTGLSAPELLRCRDVLSSVRLLNDEFVGLDAIFEFIVNKAAKGQKGQYFTPRFVVAELVEMIGIKPGETVADPACGSGGFLRHALQSEPACDPWGFDQDPRAIRVARVMMAASGKSASCVMRTDSLRRPNRTLFPESTPVIEDLVRAQNPKFRGFDVILTNPPFAGDVGAQFADAYTLAQGHRVERDVLFIERCIELLRPGGRYAIVLPHNKVGSAAWGYARRWLFEQSRVIASIGLGRNTFLPHTSQKACVLLGVKRDKPSVRNRDETVMFFISEKDGKDQRGRPLIDAESGLIAHDLAEATPSVRARFESQPRMS